MAAVLASPQVVSHKLDANYTMVQHDLDADGENKAGVDYAMEDVTLDDAENESDGSGMDAETGGEDEVENMEPEDDEDETMKLPNGKLDIESDEDAIMDNMSELEGSSAEEEAEDSDKDSSDAGSAAVDYWTGGSADEGEVEVATRNNCVQVL